MFADTRVLIKGAGDLATGTAIRLWRSGFWVGMTELPQPLAIRRTVSFAEAIYDGETTVEEVRACRAQTLSEVEAAWQSARIPVMDGLGQAFLEHFRPQVVVDGRLAKQNLDTQRAEAPLVIGLGPGFSAGQDVHAVIETKRGHWLGRVIWEGPAQPDTGIPGIIAGVGRERVLYAPAQGVFRPQLAIGQMVTEGQIVGMVAETPVYASIAGVLRGIMHDGITVDKGIKIGDIDPRGVVEHCWTVSDKALAIGGGVIEAILMHLGGRK